MAGSIADYSEAIRLDLKDDDVLEQGRRLSQQREFDHAIADLDAAIAANPTAVRYYNRGLAKLGKGNAAGSNADIARARHFSRASGNSRG